MLHIQCKTKISIFPSIFACLICTVFVLTPLSSVNGADEKSYKIHVKKGKKQDYYHMEYVLTADNLIMTEAKSALNLVNDGGKFTVHIKKNAFPLAAPSCKERIELIMPMTKSTHLSALKKIRKKRELHNALWEVVNGTRKEQKIILEINPYFKIVNQAPIELELTKCSIYFRTARDAYVDYIGNLN